MKKVKRERDEDFNPSDMKLERKQKISKRETGTPLLCDLFPKTFDTPFWKKGKGPKVQVRFYVNDKNVYLTIKDLCALFGKGAGTVTRAQDQLRIGPEHRQLVRRRSDDPSKPMGEEQPMYCFTPLGLDYAFQQIRICPEEKRLTRWPNHVAVENSVRGWLSIVQKAVDEGWGREGTAKAAEFNAVVFAERAMRDGLPPPPMPMPSSGVPVFLPYSSGEKTLGSAGAASADVIMHPAGPMMGPPGYPHPPYGYPGPYPHPPAGFGPIPQPFPGFAGPPAPAPAHFQGPSGAPPPHYFGPPPAPFGPYPGPFPPPHVPPPIALPPGGPAGSPAPSPAPPAVPFSPLPSAAIGQGSGQSWPVASPRASATPFGSTASSSSGSAPVIEPLKFGLTFSSDSDASAKTPSAGSLAIPPLSKPPSGQAKFVLEEVLSPKAGSLSLKPMSDESQASTSTSAQASPVASSPVAVLSPSASSTTPTASSRSSSPSALPPPARVVAVDVRSPSPAPTLPSPTFAMPAPVSKLDRQNSGQIKRAPMTAPTAVPAAPVALAVDSELHRQLLHEAKERQLARQQSYSQYSQWPQHYQQPAPGYQQPPGAYPYPPQGSSGYGYWAYGPAPGPAGSPAHSGAPVAPSSGPAATPIPPPPAAAPFPYPPAPYPSVSAHPQQPQTPYPYPYPAPAPPAYPAGPVP